MTTSKGASQYNNCNWEDSNFPIVCENCLGDNAFMRLTKEKYGRECGVCTRPYTVFRWKVQTEKFRVTEICQVCARSKFVCQSCIMDLEYALPVAVRDKFMGIDNREIEAKGIVNVEYHHQLVERDLDLATDAGHRFDTGKRIDATTIRMLSKLVQDETEADGGNKTGICTFFLKGECLRGEECPFRHEKPKMLPDQPPVDSDEETEDPETKLTDIKRRYYGLTDDNDSSVAKRVLDRYGAMPRLRHPTDKSITTIQIRGLPGSWTEGEARGYLYMFGELRSLQAVTGVTGSWAVQFSNREVAERTCQLFFDWGSLGHAVSAEWLLPDRGQDGTSYHMLAEARANLPVLSQVPGLPTVPLLLPPLPRAKKRPQTTADKPGPLKQSRVVPAPAPAPVAPAKDVTAATAATVFYPSQDPERIGNKVQASE